MPLESLRFIRRTIQPLTSSLQKLFLESRYGDTTCMALHVDVFTDNKSLQYLFN